MIHSVFTHCSSLVVLMSLGFAGYSLGQDRILFDATLGESPSEQGFIYLTTPLFGSAATQFVATNAVVLDTMTTTSDQAGYFASTTDVHPLSALSGFTVSFDVRVETEIHQSNDRAGFSVIVLDGSSHGVELAFWSDEIWAQRDGREDPLEMFTHGEGTNFATNSLTTYDLTIHGDVYTLDAGGGSILTGPLRNYSSFGLPYTFTDFVFLGDDTSSASARIELQRVAVSTRMTSVQGDLDGDLILSDTDIDLLSEAVRNANRNVGFDLNGDGLVSQADRAFWVETLAGSHFGDANLDATVTFADFLALSAGFAGPGGWSMGDFDGDSVVRFPDFLLLSTNFGAGNVANVCEPHFGSWGLVVVILFFCRFEGYLRCRLESLAGTNQLR